MTDLPPNPFCDFRLPSDFRT